MTLRIETLNSERRKLHYSFDAVRVAYSVMPGLSMLRNVAVFPLECDEAPKLGQPRFGRRCIVHMRPPFVLMFEC